ncbi:MAG: hypothetical protein K8R59_06880 [Thermoanaerobaculales bacterium]|nr:hypothetical protein [Thermoanaerobaculales bacterium]
MRASRDLLLAASIDPRQPPAEAAALMVRTIPLRHNEEQAETPAAEVARGWFSDPRTLGDVLAEITGAEVLAGTALGGGWPWLQVGDVVIAPGLPVKAGSTEEEGPDGVYRVAGERVLREAGGRERVFLEKMATTGKADFDLLWFGAMERFLVRAGRLEVEDLFCRMLIPVRQVDLERLLVRGKRVEAAVLDGVPTDELEERPTIEVARPVTATSPRWRDPEAFLSARIDIAAVTVTGAALSLRSERGETANFLCESGPAGWRLELESGAYPLEAITMRTAEDDLVLTAEVGSEIDLLRPGMRGRLAFDLISDLVELQKS